MKRTVVILSGLTLIFFFCLAAFAFDPPHNESSGVYCGSCHGQSLEDSQGNPIDSPFWDTGTSSDEAYNAVCLRCHVTDPTLGNYGENSAPLVKSHAPNGTNIRCTRCHHNHYQEQLDIGSYNKNNFFIAKGTGTAAVYSGGKTTFQVTSIRATNPSSDWASDLNKLANKTEIERGALLVPRRSYSASRWPMFTIESISITPKEGDDNTGTVDGTITVKGDVSSSAEAKARVADFGIFYGQQLRGIMETTSGNYSYVEFYDRTGAYAFTTEEESPYYDGICQVCHEQTDHFRSKAAPTDPGAISLTVTHNMTNNGYKGTDCSRCHSHTDEFTHYGYTKDVVDPDKDECIDCHGHTAGVEYDPTGNPGNLSPGKGSFESHAKHTEELGLACNACHDMDHFPLFPYSALEDVNGDGAVDSAETNVCNRCHFTRPASWKGSVCTSCHSGQAAEHGVSAARAPVAFQLNNGNSHHVQLEEGEEISGEHCYQCHWEADANGRITSYHGGENNPGAAVDLVVHQDEDTLSRANLDPDNAAHRLQYTADGNRDQIASLNTHCLGCHDDDSSDDIPFGDDKTPKQYAWDGNSIDARYSQTGSSRWGKYKPEDYYNVERKYDQTKAFSAHGNAAVNQRGWNINAWENLSQLPQAPLSEGDLMYPGSGDYLYSTRGGLQTGFYRYNLNTGQWTSDIVQPPTLQFTDMAASGGYIYVLRGNNTNAFYRYDIDGNTWDTTSLAPFLENVWYGNTMVSPGDGYIYAARGAGANFYRYNISANTWQQLTSVASFVSQGADMVYPGTGNYLYLSAASTNSMFYRFNFVTLTWDATPLASPPGQISSGGSLVAPGDGYIYASAGSNSAGFYRYSIAENRWRILSGAPAGLGAGSSMAYPGEGRYIYVQRGVNTTQFYRFEIGDQWPDTSGDVAVACFDCHNSHGSGVEGPTTSYSTPYTTNGGILKDTGENQGGYGVTYKPEADDDGLNKNDHKAGASLCFDCHLSEDGDIEDTPWGYKSTFGADQAIYGYFDSEYLLPGGAGPQQRYAYKNLNQNAGGHFSASSDLNTTPVHSINGLCTPCHDPHGVSPNPAKVANQNYGVPLLKGTWLTSPYKEDVAPSATNLATGRYGPDKRSDLGYNIDQNTFVTATPANFNYGSGANQGIKESSTVFAGLCLNCHLQGAINPNSDNSWTTMDRIHNTVKGWDDNSGNGSTITKHRFSCSKCHTPHNGSALPRLMITNCLDFEHRGRVGDGGYATSYPYFENSIGGGGEGSGSGKFPNGGSGFGEGDTFPATPYPYYFGNVACHDNAGSELAYPYNQHWNQITPWSDAAPVVPVLSSPTATGISSTSATLGATITDEGNKAITIHGTVWDTSPVPTGHAYAGGPVGRVTFTNVRSGELPGGTQIYYRGYATNSVGVGYSPQGSFFTEPLVQASGLNFSSISGTSVTINWTRDLTPPAGDGVIVLMKAGAAVSAYPADGNYSYTPNAVFGYGTQIGSSGYYVVYKGAGSSVQVTGLTPNATYHVAVYEFKGMANTSLPNQGTNYKLAAAPGNTNTGSVTSSINGFYQAWNTPGAVASPPTIPLGATNIVIIAKGGGGGGGSDDEYGNGTDGENGDYVILEYSTAAADMPLIIHVGGGGQTNVDYTGGIGGYGYHAGENGDDGDVCDADWSYGGAGGGGSSAILIDDVVDTLLVEAAGGGGGDSRGWWSEYCYGAYGDGDLYGGAGGEGCILCGGCAGCVSYVDPGGAITIHGGGTGGNNGAVPTAGINGQVIIWYDDPPP